MFLTVKEIVNHLKQLLLQKPHSECHVTCEEFSLFEKNQKICCLLERLGLKKYFPKKLGLQDALCISEESLKLSLSGNPPSNLLQLPFLVLHRLMSYDPDCMSDLVTKFHNLNDNTDYGDDYIDSDDDNDSIAGDNVHKTIQVTSDDNEIHPVDCLLALIICSDDFLRQDLFSRLAKCQRAVPFLIPNPFTKELILPFWAMLSIIQEWKITTKENKIVEQTCHIVSYPMPIVTFLRIGTQQKHVSKSKILNDIISESESPHNFFFHRDCSGGQYKRILGEGLVDMTWYLPNGSETDIFLDAITFLNLHGDARHHPEQAIILSHISSMCIVLITEENLDYDAAIPSLKKFNKSPGGIVILKSVAQKPKTLKQMFPQSFVIDLIKRNTAAQIKKCCYFKNKSEG